MKHKFLSLMSVILVALFSLNIVCAQNGQNKRLPTPTSSLYVISAKAGAINFVSGDVSFAKKGSKNGSLLKGDNVDVGDKVATGIDGRAEILLNPGSFLRLGENSKFEFVTTSLDDLQLKLIAGSSIFEVIADKQFKVTVDTGRSRFYLIQSGVYRIDVSADGIGKISVWKGKAQLGDLKATTVKGGKSAQLVDGQVVIAKFDRDIKSELDIWSKTRAKDIAKINERLVEREMNRSLINSFSKNSFGAMNGYGLWVFDSVYRGYCFLPYSYGSSSPYGFNYNQSIWNYAAPASTFVNNNPNVYNPNNSQGGNPQIQSPPAVGGSGGGGYGAPSGGNSNPSFEPQSRPSIVDRKSDPPATAPSEVKRID